MNNIKHTETYRNKPKADNWELIYLNDEDYFETINGLWKGKKAPFIKINVLRNTNFTNSGKLDYSDVAELDVEIKQYEKRKLLFGDIIIERSGGGPTQPVGRVVFFDKPNGEFSFSNFTSTLRVKKPEEIHHKFLFYSLLSFYFSGRTYALQGRTTGIRNLDFNKYKTTAGIPKLPFSEQRKIAHILSKIQQAIEKQEQIIKTTQELKKALMQKLFTEGINNEPQKQTEIGLIPQSWEVQKVSEVYNFSKKPRELNLVDYKVIPFIPMEYISDTFHEVNIYISKNAAEISSGTYFDNGDFLLAKITPSFENGKQCIVNIDRKFGYATTEVIPIKEIPNVSHKYYLFYYLLQDKIRSELAGKMEGSTGRQRLPKNIVENLKIPFPNYSEQEEIVMLLKHIDKKIFASKDVIVSLTSLFKTMLNLLMSGQLRVKDIDLEKVLSPSV